MDNWVIRITDQVTMDDLPEGYRQVAAIIGIEAAIRLSDEIGGCNYYFPRAEKMLMKKRNEVIRQEFDGSNHRDLARRYRLSESQIREIVAKPRHVQESLFAPAEK